MENGTVLTEGDKSDQRGAGRYRRIPAILLNEIVEVRVIVARTTLLLQDLVKLAPASVIELDPGAASQVEISVNGRVIAWGEVVTVNGNYGVRMTRVAATGRRASDK